MARTSASMSLFRSVAMVGMLHLGFMNGLEAWGAEPYLDVVISELMYNPPGTVTVGGEDVENEYIEITNRGSQTVDLLGWHIGDGIRYAFPAGAILAPGGRLVIAKDPASAQTQYGISGVLGPYDGQLDNDGERIEIRDAADGLVCEVEYDDDAPWPIGGDDDGRSIELTDLSKNGNVGRFWMPSSRIQGSPGMANSPGNPPMTVVINEFMSNSGVLADFVELYNYGNDPIDLNNCYLTDNPKLPTKARISASWSAGTTIIQPKGYWVSTETDWDTFGLKSDGEQIYLVAADGITWIDGYNFGNQPIEGASEGRYPDGDDSWDKMIAPSPGYANQPPFPSPVVINEIMYHPPGDSLSDPGTEYVELFNTSGGAVDISGWRLNRAIEYTFAPGTYIPANGYVVVAHNPAQVQSTYGISGVFGPYEKKLSNFSDEVELEDALRNRADFVEYRQEGLWPTTGDGCSSTGPDGCGPSLELTNYAMDNRLPGAWQTSTGNGTPGRVNSKYVADPAASIDDVKHTPLVPTSSQSVTVTARIGAGNLTSVTLYHKRDADGSFTSVTMVDDGLHGDRLAGDGVYGGTIPARTDGTIVEFYIQANATGGNCKFPPDGDADYFIPARTCLYVVDDTVITSNLTIFRIVINDENHAYVVNNPYHTGTYDNRKRNCTLIIGDKAYHTSRIRLRSGDRGGPKYSYKVYLPDGYRFRGADRFDLNHEKGDETFLRNKIVNHLVECMGLPYARCEYIHTRYRNSNVGVHLYSEARGGDDFLERNYPEDYDGNLYKAISPWTTPTAWNEPDGRYEKETNEWLNDWTDLHELGDITSYEPSATYEAEMRRVTDIVNWGRSFAVWGVTCLIDSPWHINNQNYRLYRRFSDNRFIHILYDFDDTYWDTMWNNAVFFHSAYPDVNKYYDCEPLVREYLHGVWRAVNSTDGVYRENRIMPEVYYYHRLIYNDVDVDPYLGSGTPWSEFTAGINQWNQRLAGRNSLLRSNLPVASLAITTNNGQPITTSSPNLTLAGTAPISAPRVEIAGSETGYRWVDGSVTQWQKDLSLVYMYNTILVRTLNDDGSEIERRSIDITYTNGVDNDVYFSADVTTGMPPLTVHFTDESRATGVTAWYWEFGDGQTSTEQHPTHVYTEDGTYTVRLTITTPGGPLSLEQLSYISVQTPPDTAEFVADVTRGASPLVVTFTDRSTVVGATAWLWDFGDGQTSTEQNPSHTYDIEGGFTVSLTVTGTYGPKTVTKTAYIRAFQSPKIAFLVGQVPPTSTDGAIKQHLEALDVSIDPYDDEPANRPTAAEIAANHDVVLASSTVLSDNVAGEFRDQSVPFVYWEGSLSITSREAIADGPGTTAGSTQIRVLNNTHPVMAGLSTGVITVTSSGADFSRSTGPLAGGAVVLARHTSDASQSMVIVAEPGAQLLDGGVAAGKRASLFLYDTTWDQTNANGKKILENAVAWGLGSRTADFTASVTSGPAPLTVAFTDASTGPVTSWTWDFGDGAVSQLRHPTHVYTAAGTYSVTLTAGGGLGNPATLPRTAYIQVSPPAGPDLDLDTDVDATDFGLFQACLTGPGIAQNDPDCQRADFDRDSDVDQSDFGILQGCLSGAGYPFNTDCLE